MTPEQIDSLLDIAGVDRSNEDARWRLETAASFLVRPRDARPHPNTSADWNDPIRDIEKQALKFSATLKKLRHHPHQHSVFWGFQEFGPVEGANSAPDPHAPGETGLERGGVLTSLEKIVAAAKEAQRHGKGRPVDQRKRRTVEAAADFWRRFRPDAPLSGTPTGLFHKLTLEFYEAVHGEAALTEAVEGKGKGCGLDHTIREVAAERSRQN